MSHASDDGRARLTGCVERITLQNINKRRGRFTFNVGLEIRVDRLEPDDSPHVDRWVRAGDIPVVLTVRIGKLWWSEVDDHERRRLAPDGPRQLLATDSWGGFAVGDAVDLEITISSPQVAHLVRAPRTGRGRTRSG